MTKLLIRALEACSVPDSAEQKRIQRDIVARDLPVVERQLGATYMIEGQDGKIAPARELLLSEGIETGTLTQTEINRTILEGSEPAKCFRECVPIFTMNSNVMQINIGETGTYAPFVAEASAIPINTQDYSARTWTAKKFGERPVITSEMVNDALFPVIELEVRKTGYRIENTLNQWMLKVLMDNAGNEYDLGAAISTNGGAVAVTNAWGELVADGYIPDQVVVHPAIAPYLFKDFIPGYNPAAQSRVDSGQLPMVMGCQVRVCGVSCTTTSSPTASTQTWGDKTDGQMGMLVFDSKSCGGIGMRQDTRAENYRDPIRDLVGISVTMRAACQYGVANAICRVEYGG